MSALARSGRWAITLLAATHGLACAGSVEGPYIVWVNLGTAPTEHVDSEIRKFLNSDDSLCWEDGALLYMAKRPSGITPTLVRRALMQRNRRAQRALLEILHQRFDQVSAFDGLIAYTDAGEPRLISLSAAGKIKVESVRSPSGAEAWGATFCNVLPPISRKP